MNSLLQVLYSLDEMKAKYFNHSKQILSLSSTANDKNNYDNNNNNSIANNYVIQSSKLAVGLLSDKYILQQQQREKEEQLLLSKQQKKQVNVNANANDNDNDNNNKNKINDHDKKDENDQKEESNVECVSITPRMFKRLVGKEHPEFGTNKQQDVVEYFRHLVEFASRHELNSPLLKNIDNTPSLKNLFKFQIEERLECQATHKVRYSTSEDIVLRIDIDLNDVVNKDEVQQYKFIDFYASSKKQFPINDFFVNCQLNKTFFSHKFCLISRNHHNCAYFARYICGKPCRMLNYTFDLFFCFNYKYIFIKTNKKKAREAKRRKLNEENKNNNNDNNNADSTINTTNVSNNNTDVNKEKIKQEEKEEDKVLPIIPFETCLQHFIGNTLIEDWYSPATNKKGNAIKCNHIQTFPPYIAIHIQRYYLTEQWTPAKHEAIVNVPEKIDIEFMRGYGLQDNEELLPKSADNKQNNNNNAMEPDNDIVQQLLAFGMFTENACKRAALAVQNASADMASQWLFSHESDANINDPLPSANVNNNNNVNNVRVDEALVNEIVADYGVQKEYVEIVLRHTNNDKARAIEWYFNHIDDLESHIAILQSQQVSENVQNNDNVDNSNKKDNAIDGKGEYSLFAIISHLGQDTGHGHYVCHIKKNGKWYFFNDSKVAISENPPFGHGYLYFFKR